MKTPIKNLAMVALLSTATDAHASQRTIHADYQKVKGPKDMAWRACVKK